MRQLRIRLGHLEVNRLGFGAMRVVGNERVWGEPRDRGPAHKVLRRAFELGMNFFDTAESYGPHPRAVATAPRP
jgi:pyridoxine 4-dehydrogenase